MRCTPAKRDMWPLRGGAALSPAGLVRVVSNVHVATTD